MQQLIYTSAPRLLESGKTGFGTVSCTRGMPKPLISYLERISTFDREAGVSSLDYYSCFRMGAARFHVFTRVCDAGADYTGRTNHLAQHFVVEEGTVEYALMMPSTPAGVLIALDACFLNAWNGQPGYMDAEQTPPAVPANAFYAWQRCTGRADNARWLAASYYLNSCCLCADIPVRSALELLHDGLLYRDDHGWGMGLSTAVVSNLSSSAFPITFLSGKQRAVGVRCGAGAHLLSATQALQPPTEADMPTVVAPLVNVPIPEPIPDVDTSAIVVPHSDEPPSPLLLVEPLCDEEAQVPPPHAHCSRGKRKDKSQMMLFVAAGAVVALGLLAWNMTGAGKQSKQETHAPVPQTPAPVESAKKRDLPKLAPEFTLPEAGGYKEPLKDFSLTEKSGQDVETTPKNEKVAPKGGEPSQPNGADSTVTEETNTESLQKTETQENQTDDNQTMNASDNKENSDKAKDTQEPQIVPQTYNIPDFSVTSVKVTVVTEQREYILKQNEKTKQLRQSNDIIKIIVTLCFDGVNDCVQNCLNGDTNFVPIDNEIDKEELGERIQKAHDEYQSKRKVKDSLKKEYEREKNALLMNQPLKQKHKVAWQAVKSENFSMARNALQNEKTLTEKLENVQSLYQKASNADKAFQEEEKKLEAVVNEVFSVKNTVKLKFAASRQADGFIDIKTELIESSPKK